MDASPLSTVEQQISPRPLWFGGLSTKKSLRPFPSDFPPAFLRNPLPLPPGKLFWSSKQLTLSALTQFRHPASRLRSLGRLRKPPFPPSFTYSCSFRQFQNVLRKPLLLCLLREPNPLPRDSMRLLHGRLQHATSKIGPRHT